MDTSHNELAGISQNPSSSPLISIAQAPPVSSGKPTDSVTVGNSPKKSTGTDPKSDNESQQTIKLDDLGPIVVNSNGTLSRIANWASMTEPERERTLRVLSVRNRQRIANEEKKQRERGEQEDGSESGSATPAPALSLTGGTTTTSVQTDSDSPHPHSTTPSSPNITSAQ